MKQLTLGILAGVAAVILSAGALWFLIPILLTALSISYGAWLAWFPFAISIPALMLGGFVSAQLVPLRKLSVGFLVGMVATTLVALLTHATGQLLMMVAILFIGGILGFLGARLSKTNPASS